MRCHIVGVVLAGMDPQEFWVPVSTLGAESLRVELGDYGIGQKVNVQDTEGEMRAWFFHELRLVEFRA